jgi:hypothetical protein
MCGAGGEKFVVRDLGTTEHGEFEASEALHRHPPEDEKINKRKFLSSVKKRVSEATKKNHF